jgi:hypothetical protein
VDSDINIQIKCTSRDFHDPHIHPAQVKFFNKVQKHKSSSLNILVSTGYVSRERNSTFAIGIFQNNRLLINLSALDISKSI